MHEPREIEGNLFFLQNSDSGTSSKQYRIHGPIKWLAYFTFYLSETEGNFVFAFLYFFIYLNRRVK